jgi:hypothetical protein
MLSSAASPERCRVRISPTPSTCPWTMWPSKRPSARIGRSRFTSAPGTSLCANPVRSRVSRVRSQVKPSALAATAVRQQPFTANRRPSGRPAADGARAHAHHEHVGAPVRAAISPTSSTIPVNIACLARPAIPYTRRVPDLVGTRSAASAAKRRGAAPGRIGLARGEADGVDRRAGSGPPKAGRLWRPPSSKGAREQRDLIGRAAPRGGAPSRSSPLPPSGSRVPPRARRPVPTRGRHVPRGRARTGCARRAPPTPRVPPPHPWSRSTPARRRLRWTRAGCGGASATASRTRRDGTDAGYGAREGAAGRPRARCRRLPRHRRAAAAKRGRGGAGRDW